TSRRPGCWSSRSGGCATCRSGSSSRHGPRRSIRYPSASIAPSPPRGATDSRPPALHRPLPAERIHRLLVGPITQAATRDLLNEQLSTRLPRSVLLEIDGTAAGNPFPGLELRRAMVRKGIDREAAGSVPV